MAPFPPASSSSVGHYRDKGSHHSYQGYHPYPYGRPYGEPSSHLYGGYDYYGDKPYSMSHSQQTQPLPQQQTIHHVDSSPLGDGVQQLPIAEQPQQSQQKRSMLQAQPQPPVAPKEIKKPPRPYTEYNIFFQLERERILGELEEEQRKKKEKGEEHKDGETSQDAKVDKGDNEDDSEKAKEDKDNEEETARVKSGANDAGESTTNKERGNEVEFISPKQGPGVVLNRPSDANDILPRPPRFAHLTLAPLWYDSTHRLAQSKLNKSRRKHRKTHGLVGFLDLTRRIAKAWSQVDGETKTYCKRVADRQLKIYKEELKMMKKRHAQGYSDAVVSNSAVSNGVQAQTQQQVMARMRESAAAASSHATTHHSSSMMPPRRGRGGSMSRPKQDMPMHPPPPPPPPPVPVAYHGSQHHSSHQHHEHSKYWQQHQHHSHPYHPHHQAPYHTAHHSYNRGARPYYPPSIPPLTPNSEYRDERSSYYGGQTMHTPLDELMHRRKLYGSRSATQQTSLNSRKRVSCAVSREGPLEIKKDGNGRDPTPSANDKIEQSSNTAIMESKPNLATVQQHSTSYLSPADAVNGLSPNEVFHKTSTAAITPSPSRRHVALSRGSSIPTSSPTSDVSENSPGDAGLMTPGQLPMKKRRKKLEESEETTKGADGENGSSGNTKTSIKSSQKLPGNNVNDSSPSSTGNFSLSPSGMMTPRDESMPPFIFGASPMSSGSYPKALVGPFLNSGNENDNSPFPYIDWGSPQGSPREGKINGSNPQETDRGCTHSNRKSLVPPHLSVPGSSSAAWHDNPPPPPPPSSSNQSYQHSYPSGYPSSHYQGSRHPNSHHPSHPGARYPPGPGYPQMPPSHFVDDDFADQDVLDLDEEEMQLLWRKLASHAKRKRMRERGAAAAWMGYYNGGGSFAVSPGATSGNRGPMGGGIAMGNMAMASNLKLAHSFSSPVERPDLDERVGSGNHAIDGSEKNGSVSGESVSKCKDDKGAEEGKIGQ